MLKLMRAKEPTGRDDRAAEGRTRRRIVVLSILLHVLVLSLWNSMLVLDWAALLPVAAAAPAKAAPLVFDLQPPDMPREVIATPDDARTAKAPRDADFLSDKNALARDQEPAPGLPVTGVPFSRGDLPTHNIPVPPPSPERRERPEPERRSPEPGRESEAPDLSFDPSGQAAPPGGKPAQPPGRPFRFDLPEVPHRQLEGRAGEAGGLSFNTYDWDFAPYMLALKRRIGGNIFPPLAYSMLGMIDGDTQLRFKIYPDGRLADLELLGYSGHRTLMETSRSAITISAPFPALPADFPKPYLEVTARFTYFVRR